jgi:hypothetical protein
MKSRKGKKWPTRLTCLRFLLSKNIVYGKNIALSTAFFSGYFQMKIGFIHGKRRNTIWPYGDELGSEVVWQLIACLAISHHIQPRTAFG